LSGSGNSTTGARPKSSVRAPFLITLVAVPLLVALIAGLVDATVPFRNDFAAYWPVGRLLIDGQNPYDPVAIEALQRSVGDTLGGDSVVRYPPWTLPLLIPASLLPYESAWYSWIAFQTLCVVGAAMWLGQLLGANRVGVRAGLLGMLFVPTWIMVLGGQIGGLLLLVATAFLWAMDSRRYTASGVLLAVLTLKPHLFVPLAVFAALWSLRNRRTGLVVAGLLTILVGAIVASFLRPNIFTDYLHFIQTRSPTAYLPVSLGGVIRAIVNPNWFWLQWLPLLLAIPLIGIVWRSLDREWSWATRGPRMLAAGVVLAPYGLVHDLVLLVPCIVLTACVVYGSRGRAGRLPFLAAFAVVCSAILLGQLIVGTSYVQAWVAPLVLIVCMAIGRGGTRRLQVHR
jgi:hypothetical protein